MSSAKQNPFAVTSVSALGGKKTSTNDKASAVSKPNSQPKIQKVAPPHSTTGSKDANRTEHVGQKRPAKWNDPTRNKRREIEPLKYSRNQRSLESQDVIDLDSDSDDDYACDDNDDDVEANALPPSSDVHIAADEEIFTQDQWRAVAVFATMAVEEGTHMWLKDLLAELAKRCAKACDAAHEADEALQTVGEILERLENQEKLEREKLRLIAETLRAVATALEPQTSA
ncbi:hypothetical protein FA15DRAFT_661190 [Coprinopsis marcescibilis]|uniref:Uncharacterized protein n=1 Tax=Coprinopsis marcescibilis TaxID=230819 RepID=A0A5C3KD75_COPMA|nr:hypothetical protein FA15DRAFT_661190 [Coprinopsis marcescibilis]